MTSPGDRDLVVRGRSSYSLRDGHFVLALGGGFLAVQLVLYALGLTDSLRLFPFGICAAASFLIGLVILIFSANARCCGRCGEGLHPDRYIAVTAAAVPAAADALRGGDAPAILAAVAATPYERGDKWVSLKIEYCPKCGQVALLHLEQQHAFTPPGWPKPYTFTGSDVAALLENSEVDTGS